MILPPNFTGAWQKGQVMIVVEAEVLGKRSLLSALKQQSALTSVLSRLGEEEEWRSVEVGSLA